MPRFTTFDIHAYTHKVSFGDVMITSLFEKSRWTVIPEAGIKGRDQHDDVIKWKHFPRNCHLCGSPVNSPRKGQWRGALMFSLICVWINDWVNNREAGDLRRYRAHYDVIVMRNYIPQYLWDLITCPCPEYLLLSQHSWSTFIIISQPLFTPGTI